MATELLHNRAYASQPETILPQIRRITNADVWASLNAGFRDFLAGPTHLVFLGIIYPLIGLGLAQITIGASLLHIVYPLVAGFALLGPFAAIGIYEISRQREQGIDAGWTAAFAVTKSPALRSIGLMALLLMMAFVLWMLVAQLVYTYTLGDYEPATYGEFVRRLVTTSSGWALIVLGNGVGISVRLRRPGPSRSLSFPLLLDRNVGRLDGDANLRAGGADQSRPDGPLGPDRGGAAGAGLAAAICRPCRRRPDARSRDMASLSPCDRELTVITR